MSVYEKVRYNGGHGSGEETVSSRLGWVVSDPVSKNGVVYRNNFSMGN